LLLPVVEIADNMSKDEAKATEAVLQKLHGKYFNEIFLAFAFLVTPVGGESMMLNTRYETLLPKYSLESEKLNHMNASVIFVRAIKKHKNYRLENWTPVFCFF
jgi:hypothetical protein